MGIQVAVATVPETEAADTAESARAPLTLEYLNKINCRRAARWHKDGITEWSISDWAVAMAGEAGEVCDAVKKLRRIETDTVRMSVMPRLGDEALLRQADTRREREAAIVEIGKEIGDTLGYLDLLATRCGLSLEEVFIQKFNEVSEKYSFPERF